MKRAKLAAIAAGLAVAMAVATVASASALAGGAVRIYVTGSSNNSQRVLLVGAIGDYGTATSVDQNGKSDPNGNFENIKLQKGSFLVNATSFNQAGNKAGPALASSKTCSVAVTWHGSGSIVSGTGAYQGISGTLKLTGTFAGIGSRYKSGRHKGQCNMNQNASPKLLYLTVTGTGKVAFS